MVYVVSCKIPLHRRYAVEHFHSTQQQQQIVFEVSQKNTIGEKILKLVTNLLTSYFFNQTCLSGFLYLFSKNRIVKYCF